MVSPVTIVDVLGGAVPFFFVSLVVKQQIPLHSPKSSVYNLQGYKHVGVNWQFTNKKATFQRQRKDIYTSSDPFDIDHLWISWVLGSRGVTKGSKPCNVATAMDATLQRLNDMIPWWLYNHGKPTQLRQGWTRSHFFGPPSSSGESSPGRFAHAAAATATRQDAAAEAGWEHVFPGWYPLAVTNIAMENHHF